MYMYSIRKLTSFHTGITQVMFLQYGKSDIHSSILPQKTIKWKWCRWEQDYRCRPKNDGLSILYNAVYNAAYNVKTNTLVT